MIKALNWAGGGELEMVRDADGQAWLLEMNPRFPAWVHGATLAGYNLPGLLIEAACGRAARASPVESREFTRVVLEIPVRDEYPLPPLPEPYAGAVGHSMKHPSGLTALAKKLHKSNPDMLEAVPDPAAPDGLPAIPSSFVDDINSHDFAKVETPQFLFLDTTAAKLFGDAAARMMSLSSDQVRIVSGYSIKTNPDARLIKLALEHGFMAEAISLLEVQKALDVGFRADQVILNGPGKWWPEGMMPKDKMHAVFCDSVADLERVLVALSDGSMSAAHVGVRIRPPNIVSRFGIPLDSPAIFAKLVEAVKRLPTDAAFGVHFHMASANIGVAQWWHLLESILRWCKSIEALTGRRIELLDMGGGWFPEDWQADDSVRFATAIDLIRSTLPHVKQIVSEPGKAMAQPAMALAMRILEIQEHDNEHVEAVVDASIAELPMYFFIRIAC